MHVPIYASVMHRLHNNTYAPILPHDYPRAVLTRRPYHNLTRLSIYICLYLQNCIMYVCETLRYKF